MTSTSIRAKDLELSKRWRACAKGSKILGVVALICRDWHTRVLLQESGDSVVSFWFSKMTLSYAFSWTESWAVRTV